MKKNKSTFLFLLLMGMSSLYYQAVAQLDQHFIMNNIKSVDAKGGKLSNSTYVILNDFYLKKTDTSAFFYDALTNHVDNYLFKKGVGTSMQINKQIINTEISAATLEFMNSKWIDVSVDSEPSNATVTIVCNKDQELEIHTKDKRKLPQGTYTYKFHLAGYADTSVV